MCTILAVHPVSGIRRTPGDTGRSGVTPLRSSPVQTVILCGGKGMRAWPHTSDLPKPLLEVAGRPVLEHVMEVYASQGFSEFVLAAGYRHEMIEDFAATLDPSWKIDVVDTGLDTNTGGRLRQVAERAGDEFFVTYADGLGNVDLHALLAFHRTHPGAATLTTVPLPSQYGTVDVGEDGRVSSFTEKPRLEDHVINAGFLVLDQQVVGAWPEPGEDLEREVLPVLGERGQLFAFRHGGFWKSLDTFKDAVDLTALCDGGAPWLAQPGEAV